MTAARPPTTTLLVGGGIHTLDRSSRLPRRALLMAGDRIVWIGPSARAAPPHDHEIDLGGAWMCPSFVDAHVHGTATGLSLTGLDLAGTSSLTECLDRLRHHVKEHGDAVVVGFSWDDSAWPEQRHPTAADIAEAAPGRMVLLTRADGHSCVVDPGTLARLPLDGLSGVDRDRHGDPTGLLVEQACEAARRRLFARLPDAQLHAARWATCRRAAALGIGSLHEMGHPGFSSLSDARAWAVGEWPVEVHTWWAQLDPDLEEGLRPGGDLLLDGSIGSRTAAVLDGYADGGGAGRLFHDDESVAAFFIGATRAGRGAAVHAVGDRAVEQAVRALEAAASAVGVREVRACRHRIEHAVMVTPEHVSRLAALGVVVSVQPAFDALWGGPDGLYARRFGPATTRDLNPLAWFAAAGVPMAFGSDSTVTPLDPWAAVHAAEHHRGGHSLSRLEALVAHTLGGRFAAGQDDVGPLRPGARADLAVWRDDPLAADDPRDPACLATVVAGRVAHGALGLPHG
ncbi:MAG TPA: amidohydrolase family protein [Egibacteraceae bacterium]|nr:amidohydrolase family protein [Egibacteraceae bacterium]